MTPLQMAKIDSLNLKLTRRAAGLWAEALSRQDRDHFLPTLESFTEASARSEWGENCQCSFQRDAGRVIVEHFDGRVVEIDAVHERNNTARDFDGLAHLATAHG